MSNFLFANITSIFHCSSSIIDIINQLPSATAPQNGDVAAQDTHELSENIDQEGNVCLLYTSDAADDSTEV